MTQLLDEIRSIVQANKSEIKFELQSIVSLIAACSSISDTKKDDFINCIATVLKEEIDNKILENDVNEQNLAKLHISCKATISIEDASKIVEEIKLDLEQLGMEEITFSSENSELLEVLCE